MSLSLRFSAFFLLVFTSLFVSAQSSESKPLDHEVFLKEMENSSDYFYDECLKEYNDYLKKHPDDVLVQIEKCKFIQFAQYDDYEDYNPNQAEFDSCADLLVKNYPNHPEVLLFQTTYLWGEELKEVLQKAEKSVKENPLKWSTEALASLYFEISDMHYWEDEYQLAYSYINKAIHNDKTYKSTIDYAQILVEIDKDDEALEVLLSIENSNNEAWELSQKADLLFQLEAYPEALEVYQKIDSIDSTYNNNFDIANTLEGVGQYDFARSYLVADTSQHWDTETAIRNLLNHDINYQSGTLCIQSYNSLRDLGFLSDPIGLYRVKLLFLHPFQVFKFRDVFSILLFVLVVAVLILIPSIWILPVYFIGHYFGFADRNKSVNYIWGLKAFWFVSAGYILATLFSFFADPQALYGNFGNSYYGYELSQHSLAKMTLIFLSVFAVFAFATLYKKNIVILLSSLWPLRKSILIGLGILFAYRLIIGIYIRIGVDYFGISLDEFASIPDIILSSRQDIEAIFIEYGKLTGFLFICLLVPVYEEIAFRGVIFEAIQKYINFRSANILQAFLFATIHLNLYLFPVFFIFGITTGLLRKKSGGLLPGIVFHVVNNVLSVSLLLIK